MANTKSYGDIKSIIETFSGMHAGCAATASTGAVPLLSLTPRHHALCSRFVASFRLSHLNEFGLAPVLATD
jgi:hypothetical protein